MRDDFNKEAMEEKIKVNVDKGFTLQGILLDMKKEQLENCKAISVREARNIELQDQIEYIEQEYFNGKQV